MRKDALGLHVGNHHSKIRLWFSGKICRGLARGLLIDTASENSRIHGGFMICMVMSRNGVRTN